MATRSIRRRARRRTMRRFLVCIHDATPAYARETRVMIRDLAPFLGRRLSFGVVPNWHGEWPLAAHPDYCRLVRESSEELLLHGYFHQRQRGWGPTTLLTESSDEMNGLDPEETRRTLERGQRVFTEVFGEPARGFLAPAWQRGHVRLGEREYPGAGARPGLFLPRVTRGPKGSPGDLDLGLWSLGLARARRPWDRVAASVPGSWSPYPGDSSQRSGAGFLAEDPPAHRGAPRDRVRTEHTGGVARGE